MGSVCLHLVQQTCLHQVQVPACLCSACVPARRGLPVARSSGPEAHRCAGVEVGRFPYVDVIEATAVAVEPAGRESRWNVDGELLADNRLSAQARGAPAQHQRPMQLHVASCTRPCSLHSAALLNVSASSRARRCCAPAQVHRGVVHVFARGVEN